MIEKHKNYYEILEISSESQQEDINLGYMRAKNAYAKDSLALYSIMSKEECEQILGLIEEAFSIISDPEKRQLYDNARGINSHLDASFYGMYPNPRNASATATIGSTAINISGPLAAQMSKIGSPEEKKSSGPLTKIVANKKFSLEFDTNTVFEQEIEAASEFSGEFLKKIREYKNVDLSRMAEMTKVSKTYLRNIEEEIIDNLPALVYVRGFIYQYAKCLKLNPDLVATSYLTRLKNLKEQLSDKMA